MTHTILLCLFVGSIFGSAVMFLLCVGWLFKISAEYEGEKNDAE